MVTHGFRNQTNVPAKNHNCNARSRSAPAAIIGALIGLGVSAPTCANVVTDWDEKAVAVVTPLMANFAATSPYMAQRMMGMVHAAMFDAVNSIERRYRPYLVQLPAERSTSEDAAAATAAAAVLASTITICSLIASMGVFGTPLAGATLLRR